MKFENILFATALVLVACESTNVVDTNQSNSGTQNPVSGSIQNVASCKMSQTSAGIDVVCDGEVVGTLINGANGKDGVGCSLTELDDNLGYSVKCGNNTGVILNGAKGKDGTDGVDGTSCGTSIIPDGSGIYVICGETAVAVLNGKNGVDGKNGIDGVDGKSCYATAYEVGDDSGYSLYCADTLVGVIFNGKNGKDGKNGEDVSGAGCSAKAVGDTAVAFICGKDSVIISNIIPGEKGKDGESCKIASATDTTVTFVCGKDTSTIKGNINITNNYNGKGELISTTMDPITVYVSSSSRSSSSATVIIINGSSASTVEYTPGTGNVTGYCQPLNLNDWECNNYGCNDYSRIYRGDTATWKLYTYDSSSIDDIASSTYEWKLKGAEVATYVAQGTDGLTVKSIYDRVGTWRAYISINGKDSIQCQSYVKVLPSTLTGCSCRENTGSSTKNTTAWVVSGCKSYAPIANYTWTGVDSADAEGNAYTSKSFTGITKVTVMNEDSTTMDLSCGYSCGTNCGNALNSTSGLTFDVGTYDLTYACSEIGYSSVRFDSYYSEYDEDSGVTVSGYGTGTWLTSTNSGEINNANDNNRYNYSTLFGSSSNESAYGSTIRLTVKTGKIKVRCY
ncbi:MAG: hypothetical protein IK114_02275 [Fibrobacter sp.]|nr:hypothetical protein [Fibrobacter sp.]